MSAPVPQTFCSTTSPTWMGACSTTLSSAATTSVICPLGTGLEVLTGQRECRHPSARTVLAQTGEAGENTPHILGLHVVEQIIRAHGGTAAFARNAPRGAKAVLVLPVTEDPAAR